MKQGLTILVILFAAFANSAFALDRSELVAHSKCQICKKQEVATSEPCCPGPCCPDTFGGEESNLCPGPGCPPPKPMFKGNN